jgi:hypothetical protein
MMEFVVEHGLGATRAVILVGQGKYGEAVRQYLDEEQDSEALDLALEHIEDVVRDVDTFDAIVAKFLWRYLSFGCRGWSEGAKIPSDKILALLEGIRSVNLNLDIRDQKVMMVCGCPFPYLTGEPADPWCSSLFSDSFCRTGSRQVPRRSSRIMFFALTV